MDENLEKMKEYLTRTHLHFIPREIRAFFEKYQWIRPWIDEGTKFERTYHIKNFNINKYILVVKI